MLRAFLISLCLLSVAIVGTVLATDYLPNVIYSLSPSFPHQIISDPASDWDFPALPPGYNTTQAYDLTECNFEGISASDISGIGYTSNGEILNATVWLSGPFKDPSSDFSSKMYVRVYPMLNISLHDRLQNQISLLNQTYNNFKVTELGENLTKAGLPAYMLNYTYTDDSSSAFIENTQVGLSADNKLYVLNYAADPSEYEQNIADVQRVIDSLRLNQNQSPNQNQSQNITDIKSSNSSDFTTHRNSTYGMEIQYPVKWHAEFPTAAPDSNSEDVILLSMKPKWIEKVYKVNINVLSVFDTGIDYSIRYEWRADTMTWTKLVVEESPSGQDRIIERVENDTSFFNNANNYINMFLDMGPLNYPESLELIYMSQSVYEVGTGVVCYLRDISPAVNAPPPQFNTTVNPNPLLIRPGEQKDIQFKVTSNSNLDSNVILAPLEQYNDTKLSFQPMNISVLSYGTVVSNLQVKVLDNASPRSLSIPIVEIIQVGSAIEDKQRNTIVNNSRPEIVKPSYLTVTILPPLVLQEHFNNFVNSWISPVSGLASFLAGVAAGVSPLAIRFYNRRQSTKDKTDNSPPTEEN